MDVGLQPLVTLSTRTPEVPRASAKDAGREMEKLFSTLLVKELRKSLPEEGFFGSGAGSDIFNGWFDEFLGERLAKEGALGMAQRVESALQPRAETEAQEREGEKV